MNIIQIIVAAICALCGLAFFVMAGALAQVGDWVGFVCCIVQGLSLVAIVFINYIVKE